MIILLPDPRTSSRICHKQVSERQFSASLFLCPHSDISVSVFRHTGLTAGEICRANTGKRMAMRKYLKFFICLFLSLLISYAYAFQPVYLSLNSIPDTVRMGTEALRYNYTELAFLLVFVFAVLRICLSGRISWNWKDLILPAVLSFVTVVILNIKYVFWPPVIRRAVYSGAVFFFLTVFFYALVFDWKLYRNSTDRIEEWLKRSASRLCQFVREYGAAFIGTAVFGFLGYFWFFTNKILSFDEVHDLFDKGGELILGRWGLTLSSYLFPDVSLPWLWGIVAVLLFGVTVCLIADLLQIRSRLLQFMMAGAMITIASFTDMLLFNFMLPCYMIAFLFSTIAVRIIVSPKRAPEWFLLAVVLEMLAIGMYQAFAAVPAGLLIVYLIKRILSDEQLDIRDLVKTGIKSLLFLIVSMACYYGVVMVLQSSGDTGFNHWASRALTNSNSPVRRIYYAFREVYLVFAQGDKGLVRGDISAAAHVIAFGIAMVSGIFVCRNHTSQKRERIVLFLVFSLIVFPLSINGLYLVVNPESVHTIVLFSYTMIYVFIALMLDSVSAPEMRKELKLPGASVLVSALLLLIITGNVYFSNNTALRQFMEYENEYSLYQSVVTQLKMMPEFDENCKVAFVGTVKESEYVQNFGDNKLFGVTDFRNDYSRNDFVHYFLGIDLSFATPDEEYMISKRDDFKEMPSYPYYGYIQRLDDYIVVKFSEWEQYE